MTARRVLVAAALAAALGSSGCGERRSDLIPAAQASSLDAALQQVARATRSGSCTEAGTALARVRAVLATLPASVDGRLRTRLQDGISRLGQTVPTECAAAAGQDGRQSAPPAPATPPATSTDDESKTTPADPEGGTPAPEDGTTTPGDSTTPPDAGTGGTPSTPDPGADPAGTGAGGTPTPGDTTGGG